MVHHTARKNGAVCDAFSSAKTQAALIAMPPAPQGRCRGPESHRLIAIFRTGRQAQRFFGTLQDGGQDFGGRSCRETLDRCSQGVKPGGEIGIGPISSAGSGLPIRRASICSSASHNRL